MRKGVTLRGFIFLVIAFICSGWFSPAVKTVVAANGIKKAVPQTAAEKIQITADQLLTDNQKQFAEFSGDVIAKQGNFEIKSDRLRIYYRAGLQTTQNTGNADAIEKIIAEGNVKIRAEDNYAQSEKAEYSVAEMQIILLGEDSRVVTGKNSITGSKIIYNRKEGWIRVEGGKNKRVRAVFYPDEKTIPGGKQ